MSEPLDVALAGVAAAVADEVTLVRAVAAGRRRGAAPRWRRVELRYVDLKAGRCLQVTCYDDQQAHTSNLPPGPEASEAVQQLLAEPFGNWHLDTTEGTVQLRVTKKGAALVHRSRPSAQMAPEPVTHEHDRTKPRLLDPSEPVLRAIGISDQQGRVKATRQAKYRQVDELLRSLDAVLDSAAAAGSLADISAQRPLRVADLGCGNAYLTFAAHAHLTGARGLAVRLVGVDVRPQSIERNTVLVTELGWQGAVSFVQGTIADADPAPALGGAPDVVLALHACDTATDEALARAIHWRSPAVLAAPCCHHDLQAQLRGQGAPQPFGLVTRQGILGERLADVLTDAVRAALLRQHGYRVEVIQFVEAGDTPRNLLLRAVRTSAPPSEQVQAEYDELVTTWRVRPALERMLRA